VQAPSLRPLEIGEILDVGFKIYTRHFGLLLKTVALVVVPVQIIGGLILLGSVDDPGVITGDFASADPVADTTGAIANTLVTFVGGGLAQLVATATCVKAVSDAYLQQAPTAGGSLRFAGRRLHSLVWISILQGVLLLLAGVALLLPAIWLYFAWSVAFPALLLEGHKGRKALGRSFRLVRRRWWPTFGVTLVAYLLAGVFQFLAGVVLGVVSVTSIGDNLLATVAAVTAANSFAFLIATPFTAAIVVLVFFDLRVRKEGLDIALLAEHIGVPAPAEGPLGHNRAPRQAFVPPPPGGAGSAGVAEPPPAQPPDPPDAPERPG